jgi:hypothetical protein
MAVDPAFKKWAFESKTLVVPFLNNCFLPPAAIFPAAQTVVPVSWEKNAVYYSLTRTHFPNAQRIDFMSGSPCESNVLSRFPRWAVPLGTTPQSYSTASCRCSTASVSCCAYPA